MIAMKKILIGVPLLIMLMLPAQAGAQAKPRDCDTNAVLKCGAYTTAELNQKYDSQPGAGTIFNHFGISNTEVNALHDTAKTGYVTRGGRVILGDKTVATDAITVGRTNISGSTAVTRNGTTFYTRPPSVSFNQDKLEAYVVMRNDRFQYAIIKSCGNPVKATPVAEPKPQPKPQPQPQPKPVQPAAPAPTPVPAPAPPATPLPSSAECKNITAHTLPNRQVRVTVQGTTQNAQITGYTIDFGDGTTPTTVNTPEFVTASSAPAQTHQYERDGTYTITASVHVRYADGRTEVKSAEDCQTNVTFATPATPVAETKILPETGAGMAAGIAAAFGTASSGGYVLYGWLRRKFL
jgi:hypothetical protein